MAPTICLSEVSMQRMTSNSYTRRHSRVQYDGIMKQKQRSKGNRTYRESNNPRAVSLSPPESPVWEATYPTDPCLPAGSPAVSGRIPAAGSFSDPGKQWQTILARRQGLLDIVARTLALIRRNHILQKRLDTLHLETRQFISSVMSNPENNKTERGTSPSNQTTPPPTRSEVLCSRPLTPPTPDSSTDSHLNLERSFTPISTISSPVSNFDPGLTRGYGSDSAMDLTQDPNVSSS